MGWPRGMAFFHACTKVHCPHMCGRVWRSFCYSCSPDGQNLYNLERVARAECVGMSVLSFVGHHEFLNVDDITCSQREAGMHRAAMEGGDVWRRTLSFQSWLCCM